MDKPFAAKEDQVLCTDCYSQEYSSRCQECRKAIMPGGTAPTPLCPESLLHMPAGLKWLSEPHPCAGPVLKAWLQLAKHQEWCSVTSRVMGEEKTISFAFGGRSLVLWESGIFIENTE